MLRILLGQCLNLAIQVITHASSVVHKIQSLNLLNDSTEDQAARRVTKPRVKLSVSLVRSQRLRGIVVARRLGLLGERHHVRRILEVPVLVGPEFARGANTSLYFIGDEEDVVLASQGA